MALGQTSRTRCGPLRVEQPLAPQPAIAPIHRPCRRCRRSEPSHPVATKIDWLTRAPSRYACALRMSQKKEWKVWIESCSCSAAVASNFGRVEDARHCAREAQEERTAQASFLLNTLDRLSQCNGRLTTARAAVTSACPSQARTLSRSGQGSFTVKRTDRRFRLRPRRWAEAAGKRTRTRTRGIV